MNKSAALSDAVLQVTDKLGYTVQEVYQVYVQVQTAKAITNGLSISIAGVVGMVVFYTVYSRVADNPDADPEDPILFGLMLGIPAAVVAGAVSGILFYEVGMRLMAPEYMAIQELLGQIGSLS